MLNVFIDILELEKNNEYYTYMKSTNKKQANIINNNILKNKNK
jgi:hypothetical protein